MSRDTEAYQYFGPAVSPGKEDTLHHQTNKPRKPVIFAPGTPPIANRVKGSMKLTMLKSVSCLSCYKTVETLCQKKVCLP